MKIRFLADADLNQAIVRGIVRRQPAVDFLSAQAAGLRSLTDLEVLALAGEQRRVLVSHDVGTMPAHFNEFRKLGKDSAGVFLVPQRFDVGAAVDELLLLWMATESSEWENRLVWLPL